MAYLLTIPPMKTTVLSKKYITIDDIFSDGDSSSYASSSLVPSMAAIVNLCAKKKGNALAKQAIVFAEFRAVFLEAGKLYAILSLLRGNMRYM